MRNEGQAFFHSWSHTCVVRCVTYAKITSEEKRAEERLQYASLYDKARKAAEVHRQVRRHAQSFIKPGIKLIDMCTMLEEKVGGRFTCVHFLVNDGLSASLGVPRAREGCNCPS